MGSTQRTSATTTLQQMFPSADLQVVQDVIEHCSDIEEAANKLLEMSISSPAASPAPNPASQVNTCPATWPPHQCKS